MSSVPLVDGTRAGGDPDPEAVDLHAYRARIGFDGPLEPTLTVLRALQQHHVAAIAFEAIDVLSGRAVDLAPDAIFRKLVRSRRGGYCFEHNGLFRRVLEAIGFTVEPRIARVRWMAANDAPLPPRTHMALKVTLDGTDWLVDVGFGACVPTEPLRLQPDVPQATAHESFRFVQMERDLLLEARLGERWEPLYQLAPEPPEPADIEMANWYTSTHPKSHFRHTLIAAKATDDARLTLRGSRMRVRTADGRTEEHVLSAAEIEHALDERFGIAVDPEWRPLLERAAADGM